jgi:hypothetical protein
MYKIMGRVLPASLLSVVELCNLNPLQKAQRPRGARRSYYLLLLPGESRPSAKHNKNSTFYFDKSIVIYFILSVSLQQKNHDSNIGHHHK